MLPLSKLTSSHWAARTKFGFPFQNLALQWFRGDLGTAPEDGWYENFTFVVFFLVVGVATNCGWLPSISKQYGSCLNISWSKTLNNDATTTASTIISHYISCSSNTRVSLRHPTLVRGRCGPWRCRKDYQCRKVILEKPMDPTQTFLGVGRKY